MPRRKKHHRTTRRRHHRMGAVSAKGMATKVLSVAAGAFVGRTLQNMATKSLTTVSPKIVGLGVIVIGAMVPKFLKGDMGQGLGDGILAIGTISTLQQFGVISGIGYMPGRVPMRVNMGAYNPNSKAIGKYNPNARAVGANRPYVRSNVAGPMNMMPSAEREMMFGSLIYDGD